MDDAAAPSRPTVVPSSDHVRLVGPLDAFSARFVEDDLATLAEDRELLRVDLREVEVLTSGGVAMLERCHVRAATRGHRMLFLVRPGSLVQRVLEVASPQGLATLVADGPVTDGRPGLAEGA